MGSAAVTATFNEIENADVAIVIGANPTENHPVAATYFKQFAKRGGKLIVMDPRGQAATSCDTHAQFKPGADVSMLNAIMNVIVEEDLFDQQYIDGFTENWDEMKAHLKSFTPEKMTEICGVPADTLRAIAHEFAELNIEIFWGMKFSQHGTDNSAVHSLALMCGQVERPRTGLHPLRGQNNVRRCFRCWIDPNVFADYQSVTDDGVPSFHEIWNSEVLPRKKV